MSFPKFDDLMKLGPIEMPALSNDARVAVTDFVYCVLEGERRRKISHLKLVEYIIESDYRGPINALSEKVTDMTRFQAFDVAFNMLSGKLTGLGMSKGEILSVLLGAMLPLLDGNSLLLATFGVTKGDVEGIMDSLRGSGEWRNYGKD